MRGSANGRRSNNPLYSAGLKNSISHQRSSIETEISFEQLITEKQKQLILNAISDKCERVSRVENLSDSSFDEVAHTSLKPPTPIQDPLKPKERIPNMRKQKNSVTSRALSKREPADKNHIQPKRSSRASNKQKRVSCEKEWNKLQTELSKPSNMRNVCCNSELLMSEPKAKRFRASNKKTIYNQELMDNDEKSNLSEMQTKMSYHRKGTKEPPTTPNYRAFVRQETERPKQPQMRQCCRRESNRELPFIGQQPTESSNEASLPKNNPCMRKLAFQRELLSKLSQMVCVRNGITVFSDDLHDDENIVESVNQNCDLEIDQDYSAENLDSNHVDDEEEYDQENESDEDYVNDLEYNPELYQYKTVDNPGYLEKKRRYPSMATCNEENRQQRMSGYKYPLVEESLLPEYDSLRNSSIFYQNSLKVMPKRNNARPETHPHTRNIDTAAAPCCIRKSAGVEENQPLMSGVSKYTTILSKKMTINSGPEPSNDFCYVYHSDSSNCEVDANAEISTTQCKNFVDDQNSPDPVRSESDRKSQFICTFHERPQAIQPVGEFGICAQKLDLLAEQEELGTLSKSKHRLQSPCFSIKIFDNNAEEDRVGLQECKSSTAICYHECELLSQPAESDFIRKRFEFFDKLQSTIQEIAACKQQHCSRRESFENSHSMEIRKSQSESGCGCCNPKCGSSLEHKRSQSEAGLFNQKSDRNLENKRTLYKTGCGCGNPKCDISFESQKSQYVTGCGCCKLNCRCLDRSQELTTGCGCNNPNCGKQQLVDNKNRQSQNTEEPLQNCKEPRRSRSIMRRRMSSHDDTLPPKQLELLDVRGDALSQSPYMSSQNTNDRQSKETKKSSTSLRFSTPINSVQQIDRRQSSISNRRTSRLQSFNETNRKIPSYPARLSEYILDRGEYIKADNAIALSDLQNLPARTVSQNYEEQLSYEPTEIQNMDERTSTVSNRRTSRLQSFNETNRKIPSYPARLSEYILEKGEYIKADNAIALSDLQNLPARTVSQNYEDQLSYEPTEIQNMDERTSAVYDRMVDSLDPTKKSQDQPLYVSVEKHEPSYYTRDSYQPNYSIVRLDSRRENDDPRLSIGEERIRSQSEPRYEPLTNRNSYVIIKNEAHSQSRGKSLTRDLSNKLEELENKPNHVPITSRTYLARGPYFGPEGEIIIIQNDIRSSTLGPNYITRQSYYNPIDAIVPISTYSQTYEYAREPLLDKTIQNEVKHTLTDGKRSTHEIAKTYITENETYLPRSTKERLDTEKFNKKESFQNESNPLLVDQENRAYTQTPNAIRYSIFQNDIKSPEVERRSLELRPSDNIYNDPRTREHLDPGSTFHSQNNDNKQSYNVEIDNAVVYKREDEMFQKINIRKLYDQDNEKSLHTSQWKRPDEDLQSKGKILPVSQNPDSEYYKSPQTNTRESLAREQPYDPNNDTFQTQSLYQENNNSLQQSAQSFSRIQPEDTFFENAQGSKSKRQSFDSKLSYNPENYKSLQTNTRASSAREQAQNTSNYTFQTQPEYLTPRASGQTHSLYQENNIFLQPSAVKSFPRTQPEDRFFENSKGPLSPESKRTSFETKLSYNPENDKSLPRNSQTNLENFDETFENREGISSPRSSFPQRYDTIKSNNSENNKSSQTSKRESLTNDKLNRKEDENIPKESVYLTPISKVRSYELRSSYKSELKKLIPKVASENFTRSQYYKSQEKFPNEASQKYILTRTRESLRRENPNKPKDEKLKSKAESGSQTRDSLVSGQLYSQQNYKSTETTPQDFLENHKSSQTRESVVNAQLYKPRVKKSQYDGNIVSPLNKSQNIDAQDSYFFTQTRESLPSGQPKQQKLARPSESKPNNNDVQDSYLENNKSIQTQTSIREGQPSDDSIAGNHKSIAELKSLADGQSPETKSQRNSLDLNYSKNHKFIQTLEILDEEQPTENSYREEQDYSTLPETTPKDNDSRDSYSSGTTKIQQKSSHDENSEFLNTTQNKKQEYHYRTKNIIYPSKNATNQTGSKFKSRIPTKIKNAQTSTGSTSFEEVSTSSEKNTIDEMQNMAIDELSHTSDKSYESENEKPICTKDDANCPYNQSLE